jgi:hypothetical protein
LYLNTGGSILIASIFHSVYDVAVIMAGRFPGTVFSFQVLMVVMMVISLGFALGLLKAA